MADRKVTQLPTLTTTASPDLLVIVDDPNGSPESKSVTVKNFFGAIPSNTSFNGSRLTIRARTTTTANVNVTKTLTANILNVTLGSTPGSNNATVVGMAIGEMRFTNTHVYVAVNATTIKRIALSTF
jgi:hypothetical protein